MIMTERERQIRDAVDIKVELMRLSLEEGLDLKADELRYDQYANEHALITAACAKARRSLLARFRVRDSTLNHLL